MFDYLNSILIFVFDIICCKLFFESFCRKIDPAKKYKDKLYLLLLMVCNFILALLLMKYFIIKEIAIVCMTATIMQRINQEKWSKNLILSFLYQGLILVVDYTAYVANTSFFGTNQIIEQNYILQGQLIVWLGKMVLLICVLCIQRRFGRGYGRVMTDSEWTRYLAFPVFTVLVITAMIQNFQSLQNYRQTIILCVIALGLAGMNLLVYFLVYDIGLREIRLREQRISEVQARNQLEMYQSLSDSFEKQKREAHEFHNHIMCIESLVEQNSYDQLKEYIREFDDFFHQDQTVINTNHAIINAILNCKYNEGTEKGITFVFNVNDLSTLNLEKQDTVILLSNLLNNAMEACEKCEDKKMIKVKFLLQNEEIVLSVCNTYCVPVNYINGEIVTSKKNDHQEHGVGIKNCIRVIEKYQGSYSIRQEEGEFLFSVIIPN